MTSSREEIELKTQEELERKRQNAQTAPVNPSDTMQQLVEIKEKLQTSVPLAPPTALSKNQSSSSLGSSPAASRQHFFYTASRASSASALAGDLLHMQLRSSQSPLAQSLLERSFSDTDTLNRAAMPPAHIQLSGSNLKRSRTNSVGQEINATAILQQLKQDHSALFAKLVAFANEIRHADIVQLEQHSASFLSRFQPEEQRILIKYRLCRKEDGKDTFDSFYLLILSVPDILEEEAVTPKYSVRKT